MPFVPHRGAYSVLLTHDDLCKVTPVKQVVVAAIVILSNICCAWTMYLCMDSVKFLLEVPGTSILWGCYYFVTTCRPIWGASIRDMRVCRTRGSWVNSHINWKESMGEMVWNVKAVPLVTSQERHVSEITSNFTDCSTVWLCRHQRSIKAGITGDLWRNLLSPVDLPSQRAINVETISMPWCLHARMIHVQIGV